MVTNKPELHFKLRQAFMTERDMAAYPITFELFNALAGRWATVAVDVITAEYAPLERAARDVLPAVEGRIRMARRERDEDLAERLQKKYDTLSAALTERGE